MTNTVVFTLCSNNYLAQAKSLGDSLTKFHPDYEFVIGLVDKKNLEIDYNFFSPYKILFYDELGFDCFGDMIERYNIVEFNTAVKPFYFDYLMHEVKHVNHILYIDPDILIHDSLYEIEQSMIEFDFILTPHLLYHSKKNKQFEKAILRVGTYNLGFLGLKATEQTAKFVKWWQDRLKYDCRIANEEGLFVDQKWINLLPCLFNNVYILKDPGYNVAYWNFHERRITELADGFKVNDRYDLKLFHYSTYNPLKPQQITRNLDYSFEKRPDLKNLYNNYKLTLLANNFEMFSNLPRGLNFKLNHSNYDRKPKTNWERSISWLQRKLF